ncbi:hypothetical protein AK830_g12646, partial [Neonectria ditissima]
MSTPAMKSPDASPSTPAAGLALQERSSSTTTTTTAAVAAAAGTDTAAWNTKNLGLRLGVDAASAACATAMIAPLIAMIDR